MDMTYTDINGKTLMRVKLFNRIKEKKFNEDLKNWKSENRNGVKKIRNGLPLTSGMPFLPMYIFTKANGVPYRKGYVVSEGNSHKFYHTKEEVFTIEGMRVHI